MQEEGILKIYYAFELFLYNYSKQTESRLFYKNVLEMRVYIQAFKVYAFIKELLIS